MTNPTWAGRSAQTPRPGPDDERAGWLPVAGVIAALGLVGVGGFVLGSTGSESVDAATPTTSTSTDDDAPTTSTASSAETSLGDATTSAADDQVSSDEQVTTTDPSTTEPTSTTSTGADTTGAADANAEAASDTDPADDDQVTHQVVVDEGEVRGAVLRGGVLYLGGSVPSRDVADQIIERAAAVVGEDNIVDEYVIDPDAELVPGAPLYVDDVVLFAYGSSTYDPQFEPLLDLGLALLLQNPSVTVTIVTHTDASGSASYNDLLSYRRGQSVAQYWVDRGVPVEQIAIDARGERDPRANNDTEEGAQLNRRAEFYIDGLLP